MSAGSRLAACLWAAVAPLAAQARPAPVVTIVAEGVYLFQSAPYSDVGLDGNAVAIVGRDGVLVFDANGTPAAAAAVLAEIRRITDQPVRYVVLSHWHWDHWYGAEVYRAAFPGVHVIAQERSRALMAGPAVAFNQPGLDRQLPGHIRSLEERLARADTATRRSPDDERLADHLAQDRFFLDQKRGVRHTLATVTFRDSLTIHLGERVVKLLHYDRAITPGDAILYLPAERVVLTGDLLVNPITYALFCYPQGWMAALERIDALDARVLVPGHGAPLRDEVLLKATRDLLRRQAELARAARAGGRTIDQATAAILADPRVGELRTTITGGDAGLAAAFQLYLVDWFVRRVYQEMDGPLDDSIPRLP